MAALFKTKNRFTISRSDIESRRYWQLNAEGDIEIAGGLGEVRCLDMHIQGDLVVRPGTSIHSIATLKVGGAIFVGDHDGDLKALGGITAGAVVSFGDITTHGDIFSVGRIVCGGSLICFGNVDANSFIRVNGRATVTGRIASKESFVEIQGKKIEPGKRQKPVYIPNLSLQPRFVGRGRTNG